MAITEENVWADAGADAGRNDAARQALVGYLRLLAACIEEEANMIEAHPERAGEILRRFRNEILDMGLRDAPVEALFQRAMTVTVDDKS
jgi:hypothetical protein